MTIFKTGSLKHGSGAGRIEDLQKREADIDARTVFAQSSMISQDKQRKHIKVFVAF